MKRLAIVLTLCFVFCSFAWAQPPLCQETGFPAENRTAYVDPVEPAGGWPGSEVGQLTILNPLNFTECAGCCAKTEILGVPADYYVEGYAEISFRYKRACYEGRLAGKGNQESRQDSCNLFR